MTASFSVTRFVTDQIVRDTLTSAMEGGVCSFVECYDPYIPAWTGLKYDDFVKGGSQQPKNDDGSENYHHPYELIPLVEGCTLTVTVQDPDGADGVFIGRPLNRATIQSGLRALSEKYPWHFEAMLAGQGDVITGSAFLECCLFGEIMFC